MRKLIAAVFLLSMIGCKSADIAQLESLGSKHKIVCYSGGQKVFEGISRGNVSNENHSDGLYWEDDSTGKLIESTAQRMVYQQ